MSKEKAHDITKQPRTLDVATEDDIQFRDMLLSEATVKGLEASGFKRPSPIQRKSIPLGRCGFDLIIQAKSGTGKTCVFSVIALEMILREVEKLQVLILAPTREIAVQIRDVISSIGRGFKDLKVKAFIGGISVEKDAQALHKCQIAVGAPGRVKHLISAGLMNVESVRLLVLDEADKLMEGSFEKDVSFIYSQLPESKQTLAASATFPKSLEDFVAQFLVNPMKVSPGADTVLLGIRQFVSVIPQHLNVIVEMKNKVAELMKILSTISFMQCLVFSNYQSRAESICMMLNKAGWPAIFISGSQSQDLRLKSMAALKEFRCRVLLTTDLTARGIDAENVNLIVNLDLPYDSSTYLHRIGRAGRYGSYGIAVTIVQDGAELQQFQKMLFQFGGEKFHVLKFPAEKFSYNIWDTSDDQLDKISSLAGEYQFSGRKSTKKSEEKTVQKTKEDYKQEAEAKAVLSLHNNKLIAPKNISLDKYETLSKGLQDFVSQEANLNELNVESGEVDFNLKDVDSRLMSNVIILDNNGRNSLTNAYAATSDSTGGENNVIEENVTEKVIPTTDKFISVIEESVKEKVTIALQEKALEEVRPVMKKNITEEVSPVCKEKMTDKVDSVIKKKVTQKIIPLVKKTLSEEIGPVIRKMNQEYIFGVEEKVDEEVSSVIAESVNLISDISETLHNGYHMEPTFASVESQSESYSSGEEETEDKEFSTEEVQSQPGEEFDEQSEDDMSDEENACVNGWYRMWYEQLAMIRQYVQYTHYFNEMNHFR